MSRELRANKYELTPRRLTFPSLKILLPAQSSPLKASQLVTPAPLLPASAPDAGACHPCKLSTWYTCGRQAWSSEACASRLLQSPAQACGQSACDKLPCAGHRDIRCSGDKPSARISCPSSSPSRH